MLPPGIAVTFSNKHDRRVWFWEAATLMKHVGGMTSVDGEWWEPFSWVDRVWPRYAPPRYELADAAAVWNRAVSGLPQTLQTQSAEGSADHA